MPESSPSTTDLEDGRAALPEGDAAAPDSGSEAQSQVSEEGKVAPSKDPAAAGGAEHDAASQGDAGEKGGKPKFKNALEAVEHSLSKAKGASPASGKPQGDAQADPAKADGGKKPEAEGDDKLPFRDHPRFREIIDENRTLKVAKEKNETALKGLEPKAKTFDELTSYLTTNNLQKDDFANALEIMALVRNDPIKAYEKMQPIMARLEAAAGVRLPDDLKQLVDAGRMDEETARSVARTRGEKAVLESRLASTEERAAAERQAGEEAQWKRTEDEVVQTLNSWEKEWLARDPDAAKLRPFLNDLLLLKASQSPPTNAAQARKLAEDCVAEVRARLRGVLPQRQGKGELLPNGQPPSSTQPVPKSALEAAELALASVRGG